MTRSLVKDCVTHEPLWVVVGLRKEEILWIKSLS